MKRSLCLLLALVLLVLTGCGEAPAETTETAPSQSMSEKETQTKQQEESTESLIDVDLTILSSTMVYSEVYNMMTSPKDYIGKTVKMKGLYAYAHDETTGNDYFACIVQDATACCAQGIEFVLTEEYRYPDDYPKGDEEICVVGVFDTYQEGDYTYCTLRNAKLVDL